MPEVLVLDVGFNPVPDTVTLANVEGGQVILFHLADKYVDPGATKFVSSFDVGPLGTRKHESGPRPVHTVDYSDAFGVAVWDENTDCKRVSHEPKIYRDS